MAGRIGSYQLAARVGCGASGELWSARDIRRDRMVALRLLPAEALAEAGARQRFRREWALAAQVAHPHLLPLYDYALGEQPYVVMRFVDGPDLATVLRDGPLEPGRAVRIVAQVASALDAAHRHGLRSRDVTPSNIVLEPGAEHAWLADWGVARPLDTEGPRGDVSALAAVLHEAVGGPSGRLPAAFQAVFADHRWQSADEFAAAARRALGPARAAPQRRGRAGTQQPPPTADHEAGSRATPVKLAGLVAGGIAGVVAAVVLLLAGFVDVTRFLPLLPPLVVFGVLISAAVRGARRSVRRAGRRER